MYVVYDTWGIILVGAWEGHSFGQLDAAISCNFYLNTVWVELRATDLVVHKCYFSFMKTDHFSPDKVALIQALVT